MMWQDLVFTLGSSLSIVFLAPTLRDASARIPLGTSLPSMSIGVVYGLTFATLDMTFSAIGALITGSMWALIAYFRSPDGASVLGRLARMPAPIDGPAARFPSMRRLPPIPASTGRRAAGLRLFARDVRRYANRRITGEPPVETFFAESERGESGGHVQAAD